MAIYLKMAHSGAFLEIPNAMHILNLYAVTSKNVVSTFGKLHTGLLICKSIGLPAAVLYVMPQQGVSLALDLILSLLTMTTSMIHVATNALLPVSLTSLVHTHWL